MSSYRYSFGGSLDRNQPIRFKFDGREYSAYQGDTLASALLANGVKLVGRSFKYHRPRGVIGMGVEDPSAMVRIRTGARAEPNIRVTEVELYDGLEATSQHCWPTLSVDFGSFINLLSPVFPAGFYYKTFMWPASKWMLYERFIRKAAGLGSSATEPDPDTYSKSYEFCDVLIVGAGPAGLTAALNAANSGARVIIVDESPEGGGRLRFDDESIEGNAAEQWVAMTCRQLSAMPNVEIKLRTTAFGYYDQNMIAAVERVADHTSQPAQGQVRHRLLSIRTSQVVLATGAIERLIPFGYNDRPGVMLASAVRGYARKYSVVCGKKAVIFTNNDSAYATVAALRDVGASVVAVVDSRLQSPGETALQQLGETRLIQGSAVLRTKGFRGVKAVEVGRLNTEGPTSGQSQAIDCDLLCVSGGWTPTVHLYSHAQGQLDFDEGIGAFVPDGDKPSIHVAGSITGAFSLSECLAQGAQAGLESARQAGFNAAQSAAVSPKSPKQAATPMQPLWKVAKTKRRSKRFVDIQNDVTVEDIELAHSEGYISVEHLKRYTTLGMGTDQGRTSNVNGLANLALLRETEIPAVGHTTFRPPYTPVSLGALAGGEFGRHLSPVRRTPLHDWHERNLGHMENSGAWQRPAYYARTGERMQDAILRETRHVREKVGITDVSSLGKIDVQGRDAAEFLERIYINRWKSLPVGRVRYGLMLREDGFVFDDGTSTRLSENEFYMTTTTANAGPVLEHMEIYAQTVWPELHVHLTSISDQWAGMALAGPLSRDVLSVLIGEEAASNDSLPYMGVSRARIAEVPVLVFRVSFSGELGYEIHMPSKQAELVWETALAAGTPWEIAPYGLEAMTILRIEKGHVVSAELNGRTTAVDLGFERMMKTEGDYVGRRLAQRSALAGNGRKQLTGIRSIDGSPIPKGAQITAERARGNPAPSSGYVTSSCYSPNLEQEIGLALIADGRQIYGNTMYASSPLTGREVPVEVVHHIFLDPQGERVRG